MDASLDWVRSRWDNSVGRVLARKRRRKREQYIKAYCDHQCSSLEPLPQARPRALSISKSEHPPRNVAPILPGNRLLSLPPEIRLLIWEYAFGGNLIAIYRNSNRLTHGLLDDVNSRVTERDIPLNPLTIRNAANLLPGSPYEGDDNSPRPNRLKLLALLQSCRLIYSEGINLLYSRNTFIFLQNQTLPDFQSIILPERFASIRSIHLHWQFCENHGVGANWAWNTDAFGMVLCSLYKIPQLDHLTIFIQGPLSWQQTYRRIISEVKSLRDGISFPLPRLFVLRLPYPTPAGSSRNFGTQSVDEMMDDPSLPFQVVRPSHELLGDLADLDAGADFGWRHGLIFLPSDDSDKGSAGFIMRSYTVFTPLPPGTSWPCMIC